MDPNQSEKSSLQQLEDKVLSPKNMLHRRNTEVNSKEQTEATLNSLTLRSSRNIVQLKPKEQINLPDSRSQQISFRREK